MRKNHFVMGVAVAALLAATSPSYAQLNLGGGDNPVLSINEPSNGAVNVDTTNSGASVDVNLGNATETAAPDASVDVNLGGGSGGGSDGSTSVDANVDLFGGGSGGSDVDANVSLGGGSGGGSDANVSIGGNGGVDATAHLFGGGGSGGSGGNGGNAGTLPSLGDVEVGGVSVGDALSFLFGGSAAGGGSGGPGGAGASGGAGGAAGGTVGGAMNPGSTVAAGGNGGDGGNGGVTVRGGSTTTSSGAVRVAATGRGNAQCFTPNAQQMDHLLSRTGASINAAAAKPSKISLIPVVLCPEARAQLAKASQLRKLQQTVANNEVLSAQLSKAGHSAGNVIAVENSGGASKVYIF